MTPWSSPRLAVCCLLMACSSSDTGSAADATDATVAHETVAPETTPPDTATEELPEIYDPDAPSDPPDTRVTDTGPEADTLAPCLERPRPFEPPTEAEAWRDLDSQAITELGAANHRGQDVVVQAGNPQVLVAKFGYAFVDKDMTCEDVDIWIQREVPCGAWEHMGSARTTDNPDDSLDCNNFGDQYGVEDDGGRVFFEIPAERAFGVGRYPVRIVLGGDLSMAEFDLIVVEPGTQAIITDIDGTLTTSDAELITEVALAIFNETYEQQMYPDANAMVRILADKGYLLVYLTGRPDLLRRMTENWIQPRFPPGPLHLTDTNSQVFPEIDGVGIYKRDFIRYLQAQGLDIVAAYGNATTDIWAFEQAGIPKESTWIIGKHAGEEDTQPLQGGYTSHLETVLAMPEATIKAPPAPLGWW